ncbi:MAG: hypothetical protein JJU22_02670 [Gammaproteobacteria bacterium]|nr:hypothetical protein [Gammaproteobacteria bacterium]
MVMETLNKCVLAALVSMLALASVPTAANQGAQRVEEPSTGAMMADLVVARPVGLVITALGTATFLVSLPFSMAGGNVAESGEKLVVGPAQETFNRCLGCKNSGWRGDYAD